MTGRLEQALRLKSHGFFFLVGIGRGEPLRRQRGGAAPQGSGGAAPRLGAPSRARRGSAGGFCPSPPAKPRGGLVLMPVHGKPSYPQPSRSRRKVEER